MLYIFIAASQGQTNPADKILMTTETSCHFAHLLQGLKIFFDVWFYTFFSWFYTFIYPKSRARQPPGDKVLMSTEMSRHFIHFLQVSKKMYLKSDFIHFLYDIILVYSPGAGADSPPPQGAKFKGLITVPICCKVQRNLFKVWFYTHFFILIHAYSSVAGGLEPPRGHSFDFNRNFLLLPLSVDSFKL